jgi:isopenicillin N synthase-like dioxygenase
MIPNIDAQALLDPMHPAHQAACEACVLGATDIGFLTVYNTPITADEVAHVIDTYRQFFHLPTEAKQQWNMAGTGSNRGWGAPGSEQVDPDANPDFKQFFDCGYAFQKGDPVEGQNLPVYAPNIWPETPEGFAQTLQDYYTQATTFSLDLLCAIATACGEDGDFFRDKFDQPMALLRGNYYPQRPEWATDKDFGIATHTDYGCLTLLATDGSPGLEVRKRGGGWIPVSAAPGAFIINFGEMLEIWTGGRIKATPHRVIGTQAERISVPLFFNPSFNANVAPKGADPVRAVEHLERRFNETYTHLQDKKS